MSDLTLGSVIDFVGQQAYVLIIDGNNDIFLSGRVSDLALSGLLELYVSSFTYYEDDDVYIHLKERGDIYGKHFA